jgi:hypothetical protein
MVGMLKRYRALLILSSAWTIGIGFRFIMMQPHDIYMFSWFDKFFDWGVLFVLGMCVLIYVIYDFLKERK